MGKRKEQSDYDYEPESVILGVGAYQSLPVFRKIPKRKDMRIIGFVRPKVSTNVKKRK